jgi:hypothetical protein
MQPVALYNTKKPLSSIPAVVVQSNASRLLRCICTSVEYPEEDREIVPWNAYIFTRAKNA